MNISDRAIRFGIGLLGLGFYNRHLASDTRRVKIMPMYEGPIKIPPFYDISHWKIVNDWHSIEPHPLLMGTKATQGTGYKDPTFIEYFQKMKDIVHCRRLAYHFFEKTLNPVQQADWFIDFIKPCIADSDILCLDFEQGGETAPNLWAFLDRVQQRRPNNQLMIYSRKNLADPISMNESEKAYFKKIPFWTAGYPDDPSDYDTTPSGYVPDQSKWGPVWAWQYTDSARVGGIDGDTDANLMEPALLEWLDGPAEEEDIVTQPYLGVTRTLGRRFESDIYATLLDPARVEFHVAHEHPLQNGLLLVTQISQEHDAQFGWNGDEWNKNHPLPAFPKNVAFENGMLIASRVSAEPSLNIRSTGAAEVIHAINGKEFNTSTGRRYLIQNGTIKDYLSGTEPQYTERHPRGLAGLALDGRVLMITVDGRTSVSRGVTLKEGAEILLEFGAHTAFDRGGGGDAVDVMDGIVQNVPCDTNASGQPGVERAVPQAILAYAEKESDVSTYRYDATAINDGTRIRLDHSTAANYVNSYPAGAVFSGDELFTAPEDLRNSSGAVYQKTGDKWLRVVKVNGQDPRNSSGQALTVPVWVAVIHMGGLICTLVDNTNPGPEPEPPPTDKKVTAIDILNPESVTITFDDGSTEAYP